MNVRPTLRSRCLPALALAVALSLSAGVASAADLPGKSVAAQRLTALLKEQIQDTPSTPAVQPITGAGAAGWEEATVLASAIALVVAFVIERRQVMEALEAMG